MASLHRAPNGPMGPRSAWPWISIAVLLACASVPFMAIWREAMLGPYDPRVVCIAREQFLRGDFFSVPTFSGMPFLEKPPLIYELIALGYRVAGEPSVVAARVVNGVLLLLWLGAAYRTTRYVAGPRAALLTTCLLASCNLFLWLAGRVTIDGGLALCLTIGTYYLIQAISDRGERLATRPWLLALAWCGLAFLAKNILGIFLFMAPLLVYAVWYQDKRIIRGLLRPAALLILLAPVALWGWILYRTGGMTYLAEALLNNSLGRFIFLRFEVADIASLPYGDVSSPSSPWWFYAARLGSLAGPALLVLPFAVARLRRRSAARVGPRARLACLCICQGFVPILVLSFSVQKGVHHLGSVSTAFAILCALWLDARLPRREKPDARSRAAVMAVAAMAPLALAASLMGWISTPKMVIVAASLIACICIAGCVYLGRRRSFRTAIYGGMTGLMAITIVAGSRGGFEDEDMRLLEYPQRVQARIGDMPLGIVGAGETALGAFSWATQSDVAWIRSIEDMLVFLNVEEPRAVAVRDRSWDTLPPGMITSATIDQGGEGKQSYVLLGNPAALLVLASNLGDVDPIGL